MNFHVTISMHRLPRRQLQQRNDALLLRHAEDQAFEIFQLATGFITEGDKATAAKHIRRALEILKPYRSHVAADLADLLASLTTDGAKQ